MVMPEYVGDGSWIMDSSSKPAKSIFPENPYDFNPKGLERREYEGNKGKIIKWIDSDTGKSAWEYHEDPTYGNHYHKNTPDGKSHEQDKDGNDHFKPGDSISD